MLNVELHFEWLKSFWELSSFIGTKSKDDYSKNTIRNKQMTLINPKI